MNRPSALLPLLLLGSACVSASDGSGDGGPKACIKESPCDGTKCGYWHDLACDELVQCTCGDPAATCSDSAGEGTCALPSECPADYCGPFEVSPGTTLTCRCGEGLSCDASSCVLAACLGRADFCGGVWDPLAERYEEACDDGRPTPGLPLGALQAALDAELVAAGRFVGEKTSLQSPVLVTYEGAPHLLVQSSFFWKLAELREPAVAGYSTPMLLRLDEGGLPVPESRKEVLGFRAAIGWASPAGVAATSPEWLVLDNRPDAAYWANELRIVVPQADGSFHVSEPVEQLPANDWSTEADPNVGAAILLGDQRTLLATVGAPVDGASTRMIVTRRSTTEPGRIDFVRQVNEDGLEDPLMGENGLPDPSMYFTIGALRLSADGRRLIYTREWSGFGSGHDVREVPIRSTNPLAFGTPIPYRGDRLDNDQYEAKIVTGVAETGDERFVFWGMHEDQLMRRATLTCR